MAGHNCAKCKDSGKIGEDFCLCPAAWPLQHAAERNDQSTKFQILRKKWKGSQADINRLDGEFFVGDVLERERILSRLESGL